MLFIDWVCVSISPSLSPRVFFKAQQNHHHLVLLQQKNRNKTKQTAKNKRNEPGIKPIHLLEKINTSTSAFQSGGFLPFSTRIKLLVFIVG